MVKEKGNYYQQFAKENLSFYQDTKDFLEEIKDAGIAFGLVTSSTKKKLTLYVAPGPGRCF